MYSIRARRRARALGRSSRTYASVKYRSRRAPVGSELAPMVAAGVCLLDAEPERMPEVDEAVFDGYVDGLREAGWDGARDPARLGFCVSVALRYGLFPAGGLPPPYPPPPRPRPRPRDRNTTQPNSSHTT